MLIQVLSYPHLESERLLVETSSLPIILNLAQDQTGLQLTEVALFLAVQVASLCTSSTQKPVSDTPFGADVYKHEPVSNNLDWI